MRTKCEQKVNFSGNLSVKKCLLTLYDASLQEDYADECNNAFAEGAEILEDDDDYMDPDEYESVVREE